MSLIFGSKKDSFSDLADNLLGIPIFEHGENRMPTYQIEDFRNTLTALHKDYPAIFGNELQSIHVIHDLENVDPYLKSEPVIKELSGIKDIGTFGITKRARPGIEGSIGINVNAVNLFGFNAGSSEFAARGTNIEPADILNHEFGHTVHNFLARPTHENPTLGDYNVAKGSYLTRFSRYLKENRIGPETINSQYAGHSDPELFAETFARARSGAGQGLNQVAPIEQALRSQVEEKAEYLGIKKMAANSRNAYRALRAMGSGLK